MREESISTTREQAHSIDARLIFSVLASPLAALTNTIVGFTVSHYACDVQHKSVVFIVSAVDLIVTLFAGNISRVLHSQLAATKDQSNHDARRLFMTEVAMMLCALSVLVILGGTLAVAILNPCE